jgi:hypothetical protein
MRKKTSHHYPKQIKTIYEGVVKEPKKLFKEEECYRLVLTDQHRLYYVSDESGQYRADIILYQQLKVVCTKPTEFRIQCPLSGMRLELISEDAQVWVTLIKLALFNIRADSFAEPIELQYLC